MVSGFNPKPTGHLRPMGNRPPTPSNSPLVMNLAGRMPCSPNHDGRCLGERSLASARSGYIFLAESRSVRRERQTSLPEPLTRDLTGLSPLTGVAGHPQVKFQMARLIHLENVRHPHPFPWLPEISPTSQVSHRRGNQLLQAAR